MSLPLLLLLSPLGLALSPELPPTPTLAADAAACQQRLHRSTSSTLQCQQRLEEAERERQALHDRTTQHHADLRRAQERNDQLTHDVVALTAALEAADAELARSEEQVRAIVSKLGESQRRDLNLRSALQTLDAERRALQDQVQAARSKRANLEQLDARLTTEQAEVDTDQVAALELALKKANVQVDQAEDALEATLLQIAKLEAEAEAASEATAALASELSQTSEALVAREETIVRQKVAIGAFTLLGMAALVVAGWRNQKDHEEDASRAWALLRPLLTTGEARLGPVEVLALKELIAARQSVHRTRYLLTVGLRILLITAAGALLVVLADTARQGLADRPILFAELLTGNLLTFVVGAGGPIGLLLTQFKGSNDRLRQAIDTAQKLGLHTALSDAVADLDDYAAAADAYWHFPDEPRGPAAPPALDPPPDPGPAQPLV